LIDLSRSYYSYSDAGPLIGNIGRIIHESNVKAQDGQMSVSRSRNQVFNLLV